MKTSQNYTIEAPLSFSGSARRLWLLSDNTWYRALAVWCLILIAWSVVLCWYGIFGLWLVPYRLMRRSQRTRKLDQLRHEELLEGLQSGEAL